MGIEEFFNSLPEEEKSRLRNILDDTMDVQVRVSDVLQFELTNSLSKDELAFFAATLATAVSQFEDVQSMITMLVFHGSKTKPHKHEIFQRAIETVGNVAKKGVRTNSESGVDMMGKVDRIKDCGGK